LTSEQPSARVTAQNDADSPGAGSTIALTSEDLSSLALWLDGLAKFIDMTKAHLPDLNNGRTLMCQRLYRHTMELKKRVQEINGSSQASQRARPNPRKGPAPVLIRQKRPTS
jgi:hypothetical protein